MHKVLPRAQFRAEIFRALRAAGMPHNSHDVSYEVKRQYDAMAVEENFIQTAVLHHRAGHVPRRRTAAERAAAYVLYGNCPASRGEC